MYPGFSCCLVQGWLLFYKKIQRVEGLGLGIVGGAGHA